MGKLFDWNEIKRVFEEELKKTKTIMTFGVFGSLSVENDLDVLITKKPSSKPSNFYREIHMFFENIDSYLNKNYKGRLIRVSRANHEEEVKYISKYNSNKDLVVQATTYISLPQIKKNWAGEFNKWTDLENKLPEILKKQFFLLGSKDLIFSKEFNKEIKNEGLYGIIDIHDRINSNLPDDFLIHKMNLLYDFILRKLLKEKPLRAKNRKEIKEIFYKMCVRLER